MAMSPQCAIVLKHLQGRGSISGVEAQAVYRIRSLARRIKDLTDRHGVAIYAERKTDPTGQRFTRYHMEMPR